MYTITEHDKKAGLVEICCRCQEKLTVDDIGHVDDHLVLCKKCKPEVM